MAKKKTVTKESSPAPSSSEMTNLILDSMSRLLHARIGTKWDLIMVSSNMPERVKEFLEQGFEPFAITTQKAPKIDQQSKIQLVGEFEEVNVIWMKRPEIIAPQVKEE